MAMEQLKRTFSVSADLKFKILVTFEVVDKVKHISYTFQFTAKPNYFF